MSRRYRHRDATTTFYDYDDGRVGIAWHHRIESGGYLTDEVIGADERDAERLYRDFRDRRADVVLAGARRRQSWGLSGGWRS